MAIEINATKFKEQCLSLLVHLDPVARVTPIHVDCRDLISSLPGKLKIKGDIESTGIQWDAES